MAGAIGAFGGVVQSARHAQSLSARAAARAVLAGEEGRRGGCNLCGSAAVTHGVLWMDAGEWRAEYCLRCVRQQREDDVVCIRDGDDLQVMRVAVAGSSVDHALSTPPGPGNGARRGSPRLRRASRVFPRPEA